MEPPRVSIKLIMHYSPERGLKTVGAAHGTAAEENAR